jgi:hypothetical protein
MLCENTYVYIATKVLAAIGGISLLVSVLLLAFAIYFQETER